jgi:hypothetical protein
MYKGLKAILVQIFSVAAARLADGNTVAAIQADEDETYAVHFFRDTVDIYFCRVCVLLLHRALLDKLLATLTIMV